MTFGRNIYGLGALVLGVPGLIYGSFAVMGQPVPPHLSGYPILVYASAALLVLGGVAGNVPRLPAIGSLALAGFFALFLALLHLTHAVMQPMVWVSWESVAENVVMVLGGVLAWLQTLAAGERRPAAILRG